jgi:hypothetical protein
MALLILCFLVNPKHCWQPSKQLRAQTFAISALVLMGCQSESTPNSASDQSDARFMAAVAGEVVIDIDPTLEENLDRAFEIIRAVCEGGFNSVSCASPSIVPPMEIDKENLLQVELMANVMAATEPNYVSIRCDSDKHPPLSDLVEECHRLVVEAVNAASQ